MLLRWDDGTNNSSTNRLMFQVFFFIKSCKILCKNPFNYFFHSFYKITKMKIKSFECPKSIRNYEKNTWNVRRLVDESFVPSAQRTSVLYCRLSDLKICVLASCTWRQADTGSVGGDSHHDAAVPPSFWEEGLFWWFSSSAYTAYKHTFTQMNEQEAYTLKWWRSEATLSATLSFKRSFNLMMLIIVEEG